MELFFLVPKIRELEKYIDLSRDEVERAIRSENGEFEHEWEEVVVDDFHQEYFVPLRLNISCRGTLLETWTISLKLHGIRIDGIDWHLNYIDPLGQKQKGWHRHDFDRKTNAACFRVPTNVLSQAVGVSHFLIRTLSEMKIKLSGVDHGNLELFTPQGSADSTDQ